MGEVERPRLHVKVLKISHVFASFVRTIDPYVCHLYIHYCHCLDIISSLELLGQLNPVLENILKPFGMYFVLHLDFL